MKLLDPEEVNLFIKRYKNWSDGHKVSAVYAYNDFAKMIKIEWEHPVYSWKEAIPLVPTEKETDAKLGLKDSKKNCKSALKQFPHTRELLKEFRRNIDEIL